MPTRRPPASRRRGRLTLDAVVAAAMAIVDEGGLDALSMRALGARLGVDATAVYRHVRSKDELLTALADSVVGHGEPAPESLGIRARLRADFANLRASLLEHPALVPVVVRRPPDGEATWSGADRVIRLLRAAGLDIEPAAAAYQALLFYTLGHALLEAPYAAPAGAGLAATRPNSPARPDNAAQPAGAAPANPAGFLVPQGFPDLAAAAPYLYADLPGQYHHGLDLLLDGLGLSR